MNSRPRVLIVDDVAENVMLLSQALGQGYDVQFATSGESALRLVKLHQPDLILLDVLMPGIGGIQALRELRNSEHGRGIPVIMVSADTSEQYQLDGLETGADDYLVKPVQARVLQARVRNLLQRTRDERQLRLADHVFRHCGEAIMVTDRDNRIIAVNPAFTRLTGYSAAEMHGCKPDILSSGRTSAEEYRAMWAGIHQSDFWQGEVWDRHRDGNSYPKLLTITVVRNQHGEIDYHIATFTDISERKASEQRVEYLAHHDALTGLPNRLMLNFTLEQQIARCHRDGSSMGLMMIDLDRFKEVNDSLGHQVGDQLLLNVADRLTSSVRHSDLVARLGGDEFVLLMMGEVSPEAAAHLAGKLIALLEQPFNIDEHCIRISASIGICLYPSDSDSAGSMLHHADLALYDAKSHGRDNYQFYRTELNALVHRRQCLECRLQVALEQSLFRLHYQPVFAADGSIHSLEALLRWNDPVLGEVAADEFIPVAEATGLMQPLGRWVIDTACARLRQWRDGGLAEVPLALNLSLLQLRDSALVALVRDVLQRHGLQGADLMLEISESTAMHNPEISAGILRELGSLGIRLGIDDFGTGYSSLPVLGNLPVQYLKVDNSLVASMGTGHHDEALCTASIAMAHAIGLEVVAEGVETGQQRAALLAQGCDLMQGFLLASPMPAEEVAELLGQP